MKKHLSVFMLMVRSSVYPLLGLFLLMTAAEGSVFWYLLDRGPTGESFSLELLVDSSRIAWIFGVCFWVVCFFLIRTGNDSKQGYTFMRLAVSERWVFFWQSIYNILMFSLFWLTQALIALGLCELYTFYAPDGHVTSQTVFLAFYRNDFLHALVPMEDTLIWVKNLILVLSLGICAARFPMGGRRGHRLQEIVPVGCLCVSCFAQELGNGFIHGFAIFVALICAGVSIYRALDREEDEADA